METLGGFALPSAPATRPATPSLRSASPNLPAMVRAEQSSAAPHATNMGTLEGFGYARVLSAALECSTAERRRSSSISRRALARTMRVIWRSKSSIFANERKSK